MGSRRATPTRRLSRQVAVDVVALGDLFAVLIGGMLPAVIYGWVGHVELDRIVVAQSTIVAGFITHLCLRFRNMYDTTRMDEFPQSPIELFFAVCCGLFGVLGIGLPHALRNMHLVVWYAAWLSASFTLILGNRYLARATLAKFAAEGRYDQRVAVFGAGSIARRVHDYLKAPGLGIYFAGVFDDRGDKDRISSESPTVTGTLDDLIRVCREGKIDRIIVALPQVADQRISDIIKKFDQLPVSTHIVTHIFSDLVSSDIAHNVSSLGPVGLLDVKKKH